MRQGADTAEMLRSWVDEKLVLMPMRARSAEEAITQLGKLMEHHGYVKASWVPATIEREKSFATGLPTPGFGVAIPHTDADHVLKCGIAVGVLEEPVYFTEMGNPEGKVPVRVVCALAVAKSELLVPLLQRLVQMVQDPNVLSKVVTARSQGEVAELFREHLC